MSKEVGARGRFDIFLDSASYFPEVFLLLSLFTFYVSFKNNYNICLKCGVNGIKTLVKFFFNIVILETSLTVSPGVLSQR